MSCVAWCCVPMQYKVTKREGTEPPFQNEYWDNKRPGIDVDIITGEPLFSSLDKFDSGSGSSPRETWKKRDTATI